MRRLLVVLFIGFLVYSIWSVRVTAVTDFFPKRTAWKSTFVSKHLDGTTERTVKFVVISDSKWRLEVHSGGQVKVAVYDGSKLGVTSRRPGDYSAEGLDPVPELRQLLNACKRSQQSALFNLYSILCGHVRYLGVQEDARKSRWVFRGGDANGECRVSIDIGTSFFHEVVINKKDGVVTSEVFELVSYNIMLGDKSLFSTASLSPILH